MELSEWKIKRRNNLTKAFEANALYKEAKEEEKKEKTFREQQEEAMRKWTPRYVKPTERVATYEGLMTLDDGRVLMFLPDDNYCVLDDLRMYENGDLDIRDWLYEDEEATIIN